MKAKSCLRALCVLGAFTHVSALYAAVDSNAPIVQLRTECTENGSELNNCFTDIATLNNWVFNVRYPAPSATSPVLIQIGPGKFNGSFVCEDSGYVTLRGSGIQNTIIQGISYPVALTNCKNMVFEDMTLKAYGLGVQGGGSTTYWHNVEIDADGFYAWLDSAGDAGCYGPKGKHYWFNSRIIGRSTIHGAATYQSGCDESWFFGSEITKFVSNGASNQTVYAMKSFAARPGANRRAENHIYGGVVRVVATGTTSAATLVAIHSAGGSSVHVHGTGIDVLGGGANSVIALSAITGGEIHANESSYNLSTVSGVIKRVSKDGTAHVHAPYQWETHPDVPFAGNSAVTFESVTGYDSAIVTTTPGGAASHPHLVIYDSSCPGKWFDSTLNQCR